MPSTLRYLTPWIQLIFNVLENDITWTEFSLSIWVLGLLAWKPVKFQIQNLQSQIYIFLNSDHQNTLEELILYTASLIQISVGFAGKDVHVGAFVFQRLLLKGLSTWGTVGVCYRWVQKTRELSENIKLHSQCRDPGLRVNTIHCTWWKYTIYIYIYICSTKEKQGIPTFGC
jgi:hypothetical protein